MKIIKGLQYSIAVTVSLLLVGCASTVKVTRVDDNSDPKGVFYALPRTVLVVEMPVTNTVTEPGLFSDEPTPELGITNIVDTIKTNFALGVPALRSVAEPDPSQLFRVKIQGHFFEDRILQMELDEAGLLVSGSSEADNRAIEFAVQSIETGATIASKAIKLAGKAGPKTRQDYLNAIQDIRDRRLDLVSGRNTGVSLSAEALKMALEELNTIEKALLQEFKGKTKTKVWLATFEVRPTCDKLSFDLFRFNPTNGISASSALNDVPKGFEITTNDAVPITISFVPDQTGVVAKLPNETATNSGFFYRYPSTSLVTVKHGKELLLRKEEPIAQFGRLLSLPSSTRSKGSKQQIALFKSTGALHTLTVSSKSWDPAQVGKLGTGAATVLEANDELAVLERKRKILEEKKLLLDAQKALGSE